MARVPHDGQEGACGKGRAASGHVTQPPTHATCTVTQAPRDGPGPSSHGESTFRKSFFRGNEQWGAQGPLRPVALRLVGSPLQVACNRPRPWVAALHQGGQPRYDAVLGRPPDHTATMRTNTHMGAL
jgi:hypothetical protein